eukprot:sb/3474641/
MSNTVSIPLLLVLMTMIATTVGIFSLIKTESGEACEHSGEALVIDCSPRVIKITQAAYGVYSNDNTCGRSYRGTCESATSLEYIYNSTKTRSQPTRSQPTRNRIKFGHPPGLRASKYVKICLKYHLGSFRPFSYM